ncbi:MAG: hypothetical protein KJO31_03820 [Gammaproteobacteria bacterium]|nr:hypothetical protein [Gammaproteobacteria bacterium]
MSKAVWRNLGLALSAVAALAAAEQMPQIGISVSTPIVTLPPRSGGRFVELPAVAFEFTLQPECPARSQPSSLLLSIADTRMSLRASDLMAEPVAPVTLEVPAGQIAPVAATEFCEANGHDSKPDGQAVLVLRDTLTAHASLRCSDNGAEKIAYFSKPLNVTIQCELPPDDDAGTIGDE